MKAQAFLSLPYLFAASLLWQGCGGKGESNQGKGGEGSGESSTPVFVTSIFQDTAAIQAHLDVAAVNESAFAKAIREKFPEQQKQIEDLAADAQEFFNALDLKPEDFVEFAFVLGSLDFVRDGLDELPEDVPVAIALKVKTGVDINKLLDLAASEADEEDKLELQKVRDTVVEFKGASVYTVPVPDWGEDRSFLVAHKFYDGATYVFAGDESTVKTALSSGKPGSPAEGAGIQSRLPKSKVGWLAVELPDGLLDQFQEDAAENPFLNGVANLLSQIQGLGLSGNVTDSFPMQVRIAFTGENPAQSATQGAAAVNGILGFLRLGAIKDPAAFPPFFNSLTVAAEGQDIVVNVTFTMADVEYAQKKAEDALSPVSAPSLENE